MKAASYEQYLISDSVCWWSSEMEQLAFDWHNLQALCIPCHASIHKAERSHSKQSHKQREDDRLERWKQRQGKRRE